MVAGNSFNPSGSTAWNYANWGGDGYYNPNSNYGSTNYQAGEFITTPFGSFMAEDPSNWDASWQRYASELGYSPTDTKGKWMRSQFPMVEEGYRAAQLTNPMLRFNEYIRGLDMPGQFQSMTATQRGENPGQYAPRARTISRGY